MKLISKQLGTEYSIELTVADWGAICMDISESKSGIIGHVVFDKATALSLARLVEDVVKGVR